MTAAGKVEVQRVYFECPKCRKIRKRENAVDVSLGCVSTYSRQARRLMSLSGASWGVETAEEHLEEMTGLVVSANTINKVTCEVGAKIKTWTRESPELHEDFAQTQGNTEFTTDGTTVRTVDGDWREVKVAMFSRRPAGKPRTAENWEKTPLPKPTKTIGFAQVVTAERLASSLPHWMKRLKVFAPWDTVITTDGAKWIGKMCDAHFPNADRLLDIYHACEHFHAMLQELFSRDETLRNDHFKRLRHAVLNSGWDGLYDEFEALKKIVTTEQWEARAAKTFSYFHTLRAHLHYPARLASGRPIGSGQVEGACKQIVGRRLKPSAGCRWRLRTVNRLLGVLTALHTDTWKQFWAKPK